MARRLWSLKPWNKLARSCVEGTMYHLSHICPSADMLAVPSSARRTTVQTRRYAGLEQCLGPRECHRVDLRVLGSR
jgi:hypothetical protein